MALNSKNKINRIYHLGTVVGIILFFGLDLLTKRRVFRDLPAVRGERLTPLLNPGAAWSIGIGVSALIAISAVVILGLILFYRKQIIDRRSFILLIAGALGNIFDRIAFGGVRDWIHIGFFPVFNLADVMITAGVLLIALEYKRQAHRHRGIL